MVVKAFCCFLACLVNQPNSLMAGETPAESDLKQVVEELGHPEWSRRQAASEKLLEKGLDALEFLKEAAGSANPELASRARDLISVIDPWLGHFTIVKVELGKPPRVVEGARWVGPAGKSIAVASQSVEGRQPTDYEISWRSLDDHSLEVEVRESALSTFSRLAPPRKGTPSASILKVSEECRYERFGVLETRDRHILATVLCQRQLRRSEHKGVVGPQDLKQIWSDVRGLLLHIARGENFEERLAALEILALLGEPAARPLFLEAIDSPSAAAAGALGLGALGVPEAVPHLVELLEGANQRQSGAGQHAEDSLVREKVRAAVLLAEFGDSRGIPVLLEQLQHGDATHAHAVMASLSDSLPLIADSPELREQFLEKVLRAEIFLQTGWSDPETEYLLTKALTLLHPENEGDAAHAKRALDVLRAVATEDQFLSSRPDLDALVGLWSRVSPIATRTTDEAPSETALLNHVLQESKSTRVLSRAVSILSRRHAGRPLNAETFASLITGLRTCLREGGGRLGATARSAILEASKSLKLGEGQLRPLVELLVEAGTGSTVAVGSTTTRKLQDELRRWTGTSTARSPISYWEKWLQIEERVAARERQLIAERRKASDSDEQLVYYRFELLMRPSSASSRAPVPAVKHIEVLGGTRLLLRPGVVTTIRDRWNQAHPVHVEVLRGRDGVRRYVLGGAVTLVPGVPTLNTPAGRAMRVRWYETSPLYPGVRSLARPSATRHQSLLMVTPAPERPPPPPTVTSATSDKKELTTLWSFFLEHHVFVIPEHATPQELNSRRGLLRSLRLPEAVPVLQEMLALDPSLETAKLLHELGSPAGREHLLQELQHTDSQRQLAAARSLAEIGSPEGIDALLELARTKSALARSSSYMTFSCLGKYLMACGDDDPHRSRVLDFVFEHLDVSFYQYAAFRIVRQVAGTDFGYAEANRRRTTQGTIGAVATAARLAARRKAVEEARRWWRAQKNGAEPEPEQKHEAGR